MLLRTHLDTSKDSAEINWGKEGRTNESISFSVFSPSFIKVLGFSITTLNCSVL